MKNQDQDQTISDEKFWRKIRIGFITVAIGGVIVGTILGYLLRNLVSGCLL